MNTPGWHGGILARGFGLLAVLWIFVGSYSLVYCVGALHILRFVGAHRRIDTAADLDAYKRFVAFQMRGALALGAHLVPIVLILVTHEAGHAPLIPIVLTAAAAPFVHRLQKRAKSLPTTSALRETYDQVTRIWEVHALPRFPPTPDRSPEDAHGVTVACSTHGQEVPATECPRCGRHNCATCLEAGALGQARCAPCNDEFVAARERHWPRERRVRRIGILLILFGTADLTMGLHPGGLEDAAGMIPLWFWLLAPAGAAGLVTGFLLLQRWPHAYWVGLTMASLHLPVFPLGTVAGAFMLRVLLDPTKPHVLSKEYAEVISMTGWKHYDSEFRIWIAGSIFMPVYFWNLFSFVPIGY